MSNNKQTNQIHKVYFGACQTPAATLSHNKATNVQIVLLLVKICQKVNCLNFIHEQV